jgi:hypothetical protein
VVKTCSKHPKTLLFLPKYKHIQPLTLPINTVKNFLTFSLLSFATIGIFGCQKEEIIKETTIEQTVQQIIKGDLEPFAALTADKNTTQTLNAGSRILVNGGILGFGVSGYQPTYHVGNTLMASATTVLQRLRYNTVWNSGTQTLTAYRTTNAGASTIVLRTNSTIATVNGVNVQMPVATALSNGSLMAPARFLAERGGASIVEWDIDSQSLQVYFYEELDYGIYFYGSQANSSSDAVGCQKYIPGQPNSFFDPSKPTIIYTHGWQREGVVGKRREGFLLDEAGTYQNTQNTWKQQGWNVAIFHWIQLADDDWGVMPRDTEKKIYDANSSGIGMRWKRTNGSWGTIGGNPTVNVTELFRQEYNKVTSVLSSSAELRLMGNSLGGNLSMSLVRNLHLSNQRVPVRITLIDPYWDPNLSKSEISLPSGFNNTQQVAANSGKLMKDRGTATEYYYTSLLAGGTGGNEELSKHTAFAQFWVDYSVNPITKHTAPVRQYMWSRSFAAPQEVYDAGWFSGLQPTGNVALSANTSNARIREMMVENKYWKHINGRATPTPADDTFELETSVWFSKFTFENQKEEDKPKQQQQ